jgi:outer membrane protein TolC
VIITPKYIKFLIISLLFFYGFLISARAEETLTWEDCIKEAAKNHPDLIASQESVKQSEASKKITASTLFPQVDSNLSAKTARTDTGTSNATGDTYTYGVTGTQLLFDGTKTINNVKAAKEFIIAAKQGFRFTSSQVRFRLRTAFVNLLKAQEMLRITEEIYNIRRGNLELITLRYQSGLEHKGALLTAEANLAQAQYENSQAKRDVEVARRELTKEMGRTQLTPIEVKGDLKVKDAAQEKPDFEALAKNNPSLQQLIAQKNSADFSLKSAYANFSPTLSGQAGANKSSSHWSPQNDQWNLGLTLSMPIFEGGLRFAQVSQAKALLNQLRANERSTADGVVLTLEQTWAALQDAMDNVQVQEKSLIAAEERSKIAQAQYSTGFISFDNWTIIEDNLVRAKTTFLDAQANALLTEANWIQAKGETLEYE